MRAQRACKACQARKERCDFESPCNRCQKRGVVCSRTRQETVHDKPEVQEAQALPSTDLVGPIPGATRWIGQDYIDIYFRDFHPTWPFLHPGTFDTPNEPCVLLQSMVMIGLWIKGDDASRAKATSFHFKILSAIGAQRVRANILVSNSGICC